MFLKGKLKNISKISFCNILKNNRLQKVMFYKKFNAQT